MYSHTGTRNENDEAPLSDTKLTVADILSSMANSSTEPTTGTTTFSTLDGLTSGIPTRTTPTLTPTTLKNIEESFLDLQSIPPAPMEHQHQAGFVPPVVNISVSTSNSQTGSSLQYQSQSKDDDDLWLSSSCIQSPGELSPSSSVYQSDTAPCTTSSSTTTKGRNMGGRRPNRNDSLTPEEEERRRVRRERNKLAAARCRKRRLDHTNSLLKETEGLEEKRLILQQEIQLLKSQKEELEFLLEAHKATCKMIKHHQSRDCSQSASTSEASHSGRTIGSTRKRGLNRPTSLAVSSAFTNQDNNHNNHNIKVSTSVAGVPINTPSTGMFNFESLMEGGTGLTPVSSGLTPVVSSCSGQQRNSSSDLSSPDGVNPPKLVSL